MSWPIRFHETPPDEPKTGDAWYADYLLDPEYQTKVIAPEHRGKRPIEVMLPCGSWFCIHSMPTMHPGSGWRVSGEPHAITVEPSILIAGRYHGWIRDGVITDDCEGRTFEAPR